VLVLAVAVPGACAERGPRITDEAFFATLQPGYPGLERVEKAVASGDYASARHEFAEYLRNRKRPVWHFDPFSRPKHDKRPENVDTTEADRILRHELPSCGVYHKFEGEIDWNLNPINYKEWPWQLNRHAFWVTLGRAYWATGEEKYAREFVHQMTDWVAKNPVPVDTSGNETYTWRTIEQGIRCSGSWPESFYLFLTSPSFTDDAMVTMVKSFVEHARQLTRWHTGGNWLTMEADGLMHVGVLFPEFKEAADWRRVAAERLYAELDRQVYPDGAQIELTTGYHQVSLDNFLRAWRIARMNDFEMPADYIAKLEKMFDYNLAACMPDGTLPDLNDGARVNVRTSLARALELFPTREDFKWVATSGKQGRMPSFGSVALAFSGQLVMRSGWDTDDLYLLMDAGPFGYGHQHEDALSIVVYAHGRYHLVDPGNYAYDSSQWRKYVLSTRAHNTVMVDGLEQHRRGRPREQYVVAKPLPNKWASTERFDYAAGRYDDGYGDNNEVRVSHARHVFFVKPEYWIVTDFLTPADDRPHLYESMFHLDADGAAVDQETGSVSTTNKNASNLAIYGICRGNGLGSPRSTPDASAAPTASRAHIGVRVVSGQVEPVVQGWVPKGGVTRYECRPIPTPIFSQETAGPTGFAYVLYPTPAGAKCPIDRVERVPVDADGGVLTSGVAVRFGGGRIDYFIQAPRRTRLKFLDFEADAAGVYLRTAGGRVVSAALVDGTVLARGGERIAAESLPVRDLSRTKVRHAF